MPDFDTRRLRGYGATPPNPRWPNGARIAVSFVVNYEEGGEHTPANGDAKTEVFLNETPGGAPRADRDMNMETQYEYGSRAGVWRILRLFAQRNWKFTCYAIGRAVELNPEPVKAMAAQGHEIASHNYRWIDYATLTETEERKHVQLCIKELKNATGKAPVGWYTGRISPHSRRIVQEEYARQGLPLLYDSDAYNDDLPYYLGSHLVIPYTLDANDMKFCVAPGFTAPDDFFQYLKNTFDVLYAEGVAGQPKFMNVGLHCRLVGKPGRAAALQRFLEYLAGFPDVWVCTREEMARHWRKEHPARTGKL
ncbi:hypothetical protein BC830DRAFT_1119893 [Chytriomyces sp. MP71]|nr:hypothetical protein BC830DRAFT_1119893 [Chytriomyces sp. MP71]